MQNFITPVINSKAADKDLFDIKSRHSDILLGMTNQAARVQEFNQNREMVDTERMKIKTESDKNRMESDRKNKELEIKKLALITD